MHSSVESSPSKGDASSLAPSLRANKLLDAFLVYKRQKVGFVNWEMEAFEQFFNSESNM